MPFFDNVPASFIPRQKFFRGNLVTITRPKSVFTGGRAIVIGSYLDTDGGCHGYEPMYSVLLEEGGIFPGVPLVRGGFYEHELTTCHDELPYNGLKDPIEFHELTERILQYYNESRYKTS